MFRRHSFTPEEVSASAEKVVATLETAGIDPGKAVILGGGALALAGIRPTSNDVDVMVTTDHYQAMEKEKRTPSGLILQDKPFSWNAFLETDPDHLPKDMLAIDITRPHGHQTPAELDEIFLREMASFDRAGDYAYLPPEAVAIRKETIRRSKDRRDVRRIKQFLDQ